MASKNKLKNIPKIQSDESGFTLIEVLAALSIFTIVGVATFSVFQKAAAVRNKLQLHTSELTQLSRVQSKMISELSAIQNFSLRPFRGNADSICFTVLKPKLDGTEQLRNIAYFIETDMKSNNVKLVRSDLDFLGNREIEVLLTSMEFIRFHFLKWSKGGPSWIDHWSSTGGLPAAIKIQMSRTDNFNPVEIICPLHVNQLLKWNENSN